MNVVFEFVQYIDEDDSRSVGIGLSAQAIRWLSAAHASIDIDQYLH